MAEFFSVVRHRKETQFQDEDENINSIIEDSSSESIQKIYLPPEILLEVIKFLDLELIILSSVICKGFYDIYRHDELWSTLLSTDWKLLKENSNENDDQLCDIIPPIVNDTKSPSFDHHNTALANPSEEEELYYYKQYKERYLRYKKWRDSIAFIYPEERNQYRNNMETKKSGKILGYIKYLLSFPVLFYRLLIFLFISQYEQPDFGLAHETEYIQEKSLRAGGSLILVIAFAPIVVSTWMIGELPVSGTPLLAKLHVFFKIAFTLLCIMFHFFNRMDKNIEFYKGANIASLLIIVQTLLTLILMRYVDDFIISCLIVFNMSTALGLAISLKHMIKNTETIENLFDTTNAATHHYLSSLFGYFRNRSVVTNLILVNLLILVIMIGGFKTIALIIVIIVLVTLTSLLVLNGGGGVPSSDIDFNFGFDGRSAIFFVMIAASFLVFKLAEGTVGGNYKKKSWKRNTGAVILLVVLTLSFISLATRVLFIKNEHLERWPLSTFETEEE